MTFPFMFTETEPGPSSIGISLPSSEKMATLSRLTAGKHSSIKKNKAAGAWSTFTIPGCRSPESAKASEQSGGNNSLSRLASEWERIRIDRLESGPLYCSFALEIHFSPACLESFREQRRGEVHPEFAEGFVTRWNFRN